VTEVATGSFVLTNDGPTPPNVEVPGEIRYSDGTVDRVSLPTAEAAHRPRLVGPLGANVYNKDRSALPPALPPAPPPAAAAAPPPAAAGSVDPSAMPTRRGPSARKGTGTEGAAASAPASLAWSIVSTQGSAVKVVCWCRAQLPG
jgi:hypothetical protein